MKTTAEFITLPDGSRAYKTELSFIKHVRDMRTGTIKTNVFFVPDAAFFDGKQLGFELFVEMLDQAKADGCLTPWFFAMVREVAELSEQQYCPDQPNRMGAATAMMQGISSAVMFLARHGQYQTWAREQVAIARQTGERAKLMREQEAQRRIKRTIVVRKRRKDAAPKTTPKVAPKGEGG